MRKIMAKYKVKNTTILHDGVSRGEGSIIELTDLQAKKLEGFVELVKEKAPAKQNITIIGVKISCGTETIFANASVKYLPCKNMNKLTKIKPIMMAYMISP